MNLADRLAIIREMRTQPAVVAQELHELRILRRRAETLAGMRPAQTNLGAGIHLAARIIAGRVHDPETWIRAMVNLGDDKP